MSEYAPGRNAFVFAELARARLRGGLCGGDWVSCSFRHHLDHCQICAEKSFPAPNPPLSMPAWGDCARDGGLDSAIRSHDRKRCQAGHPDFEYGPALTSKSRL